VYLPREDEIMRGEFKRGERRIQGENHRWEMRRVHMPEKLAGWNPFWITATFLTKATVNDERKIQVGPIDFEAVFVDVEWLDRDSLVELVRLSSLGGKIVLGSSPREPGLNKTSKYGQLLKQLVRSANVLRSINELAVVPLVEGDAIPPYWVRRDDECYYFFFSHPASHLTNYPMERGQAAITAGRQERTVMLNVDGSCLNVDLVFGPLQSVSLSVSNSSITALDIGFERQ
jgi:hypothetical protein